jgi:circadian clock protein KaiC
MRASKERVSTGIERLDTMLEGGYFRNASVLITGSPGTAKTTLAGAFAEAACARGERTLFVCFDSEQAEVIRNLGSVGIRFDRHVKSGCLRLVRARSIHGNAEIFLANIKALATGHSARCLVIDPISTWSNAGNDHTAAGVVERLIDWSKTAGITVICTRLLGEMFSGDGESASQRISTLADTWIHLSYEAQSGERNRGLSIIKSRGMAHSNQVRELILDKTGVTLADTYSAGGKVLMGTMRWERESNDLHLQEASAIVTGRLQARLAAEAAEIEGRIKSMQVDLEAKQDEQSLLTRSIRNQDGERSRGRSRIDALRGADAAGRKKKAGPA